MGNIKRKPNAKAAMNFARGSGIRSVIEKGGMEFVPLPRLSESVQGSAGQSRQQRGETYPGDRRYAELLYVEAANFISIG